MSSRTGSTRGLASTRARALGALVAVLACAAPPPTEGPGLGRGDALLVVDCLLPGQVRRLGNRASYLTPRQATKLPAGECAIRGGEYTAYDRASLATSLRIWLPRAEQGDVEAQTYVGEMFERGLGVPADHAAAAEWYRRAADQGYPRAQINLGSLYERGLGVPRDPASALELYRLASGLHEPVFEVAAPVGELQRLRTEVGTLRRQLDAKQRELERTQRRIESLEQQLREGQGEVERERSELESMRRLLAGQQAAADEQRELAGMIAESEQRLAAKQAELARVQDSLQALEREGRERQAEVERLREQRETAGPTIEIIQPEVYATRGTRGIRLEAAVSELMLVGRVTASAGLLALTVNGEEHPLDSGLFRARVPLMRGMERIRVVAVDRAGRRAVEDLALSSRAALPAVELAGEDALGIPVPYGGLDFGRYHALVIGNNEYRSLPDLETAVTDAKVVADTLRRDYDFEVTLLLDATRYELLSALNRLRKRLSEEDNLLIYYAGHGDLDRVNQRGHWLPVDAERESTANWVSNIAITDILNTMSVRQLLVVADSCYSGTLTRSAVARLEAGRSDARRLELVRALMGRRARMVLTSGGLEPVLDSVGGEHSDFAQAFLEAIRLNRGILTGRELHEAILPRVATTAGRVDFHQVPEYAPIKYAGHESGDFFLVRAEP